MRSWRRSLVRMRSASTSALRLRHGACRIAFSTTLARQLRAFIDAEHAMDPLYARNLGADIDELLVSQPDYGEHALEVADMLVRDGAVDVVAVDSVAALTPRAELEGQIDVQARMVSHAKRKLAGNLYYAKTFCVFFVGQIREKVGAMFGPVETQLGAR
jgi:recombination protein RecA